MRHVISETKEKLIIVGLATLVAFFGFEVLQSIMAAYEIPTFVWASFVVYSAIVFLETFVFDLHIKRSTTHDTAARNFWHALRRRFRYMRRGTHWINFQNYLILPGIVFWSTVALIFLNPFNDALKQTWIILSTLALTMVFWYLKTVFYDHKAASHAARQYVFLVKLYAAYVAFAALFGIMRFFGFDAGLFALASFSVTFLLVYQAMFQHHNVSFETFKLLLLMSATIGVIGVLLYVYWTVNYFTGALVMTAMYNTVWGLIHHKFIDKDLTKVIVYEYLAVLFLVLVIIFSTTNFAERI